LVSPTDNAGEGDAVAFNREIQIPVFSSQQEISNHPADEIEGEVLLVRKAAEFAEETNMSPRETTQETAVERRRLQEALIVATRALERNSVSRTTRGGRGHEAAGMSPTAL